MKKVFALLLVVVLVFSLAACGNKKSDVTVEKGGLQTDEVSEESSKNVVEKFMKEYTNFNFDAAKKYIDDDSFLDEEKNIYDDIFGVDPSIIENAPDNKMMEIKKAEDSIVDKIKKSTSAKVIDCEVKGDYYIFEVEVTYAKLGDVFDRIEKEIAAAEGQWPEKINEICEGFEPGKDTKNIKIVVTDNKINAKLSGLVVE